MAPAGLIRQFVQHQGNAFGVERSFKLKPRKLLSERVLYSLNRADLRGAPEQVLAPLLDGLQLPEDARQRFLPALIGADLIHLGYDDGAGAGAVCKLYAEYAERARDALASASTQSVLVHRALKWQPGDPVSARLSDYRLYPGLDYAGLKGRIAALDPRLEALMAPLLEQCAAELPASVLFYLEVCEEGSERRSFDLKFYEFNWPLQRVEPWLKALWQQMELTPGRWHSLWAALRQETLGHLSAGIGRDGAPFVTLYYGGRWLRKAVRA